MEHGPIPPHERAWRHPSELAAEERAVVRAETSPAISRAFALTTGTIGLFAIVVLVLAVTPSDPSRPMAVSATTTPAALVPAAESALDGATIASARRAAASASPNEVDAAARLLATPIGSGRYALISQASIGNSPATTFDVTLPSGRTTVGQVVERSIDAVLVVLDDAEPGHDVAEDRPHDREVVTVMASPPVTIAFADVSTLEVAEGTAVVDRDGDLVGLCTRAAHGRGVRLIAVDAAMATLDDVDVPRRPKAVHDGAPAQSPSTTVDDTEAIIVAADSTPDQTDDASATSSSTSSTTTTTTTVTTTSTTTATTTTVSSGR